MKSYGRAPTFLLATGYEQARSVVAMLAGGCCGGPARAEANACCVDDAVAKAEGKSGCGCGRSEPALIQIGVRSQA